MFEQQPLTIVKSEPLTLAKMIRAKHPDAYNDMTDEQLEAAVDRKHPGAYDDIPRTAQQTQTAGRSAAKLQQIVESMVAAGESEDDIALVIREYKKQPPTHDWFAQNAPQAASGAGAEVVIRGSDGTEHVFPSGFDPKRAAEIVRNQPTRKPTGDVRPPTLGPMGDWGRASTDFVAGAAKGAWNTAIGVGELYHMIPGFSEGVESWGGAPAAVSRRAFDENRRATEPTSTAESFGRSAEQIAEFFVPGAKAEKIASVIAARLPKYTRLLPHLGAQAGANASIAQVQGHDPTSAAVTGALIPAISRPAAAAVRWAGNRAEPLVRSAIKPTVSAMRKIAGASVDGLDAKAEQLVRFIIDNRVTTPQKAMSIMAVAEGNLRAVLSKATPTDAAQRAARYLTFLERSASRQGLPASDVAIIRNAAAELLEGPMGENVVTMVPTQHPTLLGANGQPITVLTPQVTRQLRAQVPADEALDAARSSSQWSTRKQWGEQKGARMEAEKAVERAQRDAVKTAVPEARPLLQQQGMAKQAADVLDRMQLRAGNRDALGLPASIIAAAEVSHGKIPLAAFAANWLRNNQLKSGMWAHALKKAVERNDVRTLASAFERLGIALPPNVEGYSPPAR